jgi:hypothetical protein
VTTYSQGIDNQQSVDFVIRRREKEKVLASTSDVQDGREMVAGMTGGDE